MDVQETLSLDSLLDYLGGCGLFQVIAVLLLHGTILAGNWSMMLMAYGNYNPGWSCQDNDLNSSFPHNYTDGSTHSANDSSCQVYVKCKNVVYSEGESTIATEWDLLCDRKWITNLMISIQMVGVLIGALIAGQLNFTLGRKKTLYGTLAIHAIFNIIASLSVDWSMFLVIRFFIGLTCGSIMLTAFVYPMEFVINRWRGVVAPLPFSNAGNMTFAVATMLLRDWRHIHQATAALSLVLFLPVFWAPDSLRWLAVKNKTKQAEKAALQIAKLNKKLPPNMDIIHAIAENETLIEKSKPRYSILDLYRHGLLKRTLVLGLSWLTNTLVYYLILYDAQSLSGNFHVNLLVFPLMPIAALPLVPLLTNTVGRRWGIIGLMAAAAILCLAVVCLNFVEIGFDKGQATRVLIFLIMILIEANWSIAILYNVELYPTVLRSLSYSHGLSVGRVGGMIAPFLIPRDPSTIYIPQFIMLVLIGVTCFCLFLLPETKGRLLEESVTLNRRSVKKEQQEENETDTDII